MESHEHYKNLLEAEKEALEKQLSSVGRKIDANGDWVATAPVPDTREEDPNTQADRIETFETNIATVNVLEVQYQKVIAALDRIQKGTYGICEETGQPIPPERLEVIPTATTSTPKED